MTSEINLKRKLIEATDAVRKKNKALKLQTSENRLGVEEFHEPVTTQLKSLSGAIENVTKQLPKKVDVDVVTPRGPHTINSLETSEDEDDSTFTQFFDTQSMPTQTPLLLSPEPEFTNTPTREPMSDLDLFSVKPKDPLLSSPEKTPYALVNEYARKIKSNVRGFDTTYGIYPSTDGKLRMGKCIIRFPSGGISISKNNKILAHYPISTELVDLIFLQRPNALKNLDTLSKEILNTYHEILMTTNSLYHSHNPLKGIRTSGSEKYLKIIKPLLEKQGSGLEEEEKEEDGHSKLSIPKIKTVNLHRNINYVYWNKPKELVERLKLLWASKQAGNTGTDNEIISIIEELREENIIY